MTKKTEKSLDEKRIPNQRTLARLSAVQALYQMDVGQASLETTLKEFTSLRKGAELEGEESLPADHDFLTQIVKGVTKNQLQIDPDIDGALDDTWPVGRIDATMRAILRSATFELSSRKDIAPAIVINEYVEIAKSFFENDVSKMVNGVLDKIAKSYIKE
ncbi:MAG: transcription antitermination factor NusB [Devosiaceae bacterium]|nr:transcription antitermination factor NusB [Devosiaceae bacterium]